MGLLGEALKVAVSKPPSGGAANEAVIELLANALAVRESQVAIVAGHSSARKEIEIAGLSAIDLEARLIQIKK